MLKYLIFILVFNSICFAQDSDIYEISDRKFFKKLTVKREIENKDIVKNKSEQEVILSSRENKNSVKRVLPQNENENASPISSQNTKVLNTNDNSSDTLQLKNEDVKDKQTKTEESKQNNASQSEKKVSTIDESNNSSTIGPTIKNPKNAIEHPGAALRGFYVFLGLSVLIIIYFVFKAFRLRPGAPPPTTVRKYGVVGRRSDMEMLPLPLAEEEDDDTLFDMGTQINR